MSLGSFLWRINLPRTTRRNPESRKKLVMLSCWDYTVYIQQWRVASRWQYWWQQNLQSVNKSCNDKMHKCCDIGNTRTQSDATWIMASNNNTCMPFLTYHPTFGKPQNWLRRLLRSGKYETAVSWSSEKWETWRSHSHPGDLSASLWVALANAKQSPILVFWIEFWEVGNMGELSAPPLCSATCWLQFYPNYPTLNDSLGGKRLKFWPKITCCSSSKLSHTFIHPCLF